MLAYAAATTNATNKITATPATEGDTVVIMNGAAEVTNGTSATWAAGENLLTITVGSGSRAKTYTVTVTKS